MCGDIGGLLRLRNLFLKKATVLTEVTECNGWAEGGMLGYHATAAYRQRVADDLQGMRIC
jgi:hypothetical protein